MHKANGRTVRALGVVGVLLLSLLATNGASAHTGGDGERLRPDTATNDRRSPNGESDYFEPDDPVVITDTPGLGRYGPDGQISRSALPESLRDYISSEAISMANSPELQAVRKVWRGPNDFVDQVDYQIMFRDGYDFLDSSPGQIASAMATGSRAAASFEEMGLLLAPAEAAELARRDRLGQEIEGLERAIGARAGLVEIWQDQHDGGKLVAYVTSSRRVDRRAVARKVGWADLRIVQVPYSRAEVRRHQLELHDQLVELGVSFSIGHVRTQRSFTLEVMVEDLDALPESFGAGVPKDLFSVVEGPTPTLANDPDANHNWADLQPGQTIYVDNGPASWCTWGINGHTSNWNYLVTAGHCLADHENFSGWVSSANMAIWNGSRSANTIYKRMTASSGNVFVHSNFEDWRDAARVSVYRANTNCYHGTESNKATDCPWRIQDRTYHNSWEVGSDRTCASLGRSNAYRCGKIEDENVSASSGAFDSNRMVELQFTADPGDSGSGAKWENTFDGIITMKKTRFLRSDRSLMVTAYDVKRSLGSSFDFNCAAGFARKNADEWGACPTRDR